MNLLDEFLDSGCSFDWITPAVAFVQDLLHRLDDGPISDFGVDALAGWGDRDIKRLLGKQGVKAWGFFLLVEENTLGFTVPESQAWWTYYLLERSGIPILYAPADIVESFSRRRAGPIPYEAGSSSTWSASSVFRQLFSI